MKSRNMNLLNKQVLLSFLIVISVMFSGNVVLAQTPTAANYLSLGYKQIAEKRYDEAIKSFTACIEVDAKSRDCFLGRGYANYLEFNENSMKAAIADLTKAIRIDPQNYESYFLRGTSYKALEEFDLAIADFSKAIEIDPINKATYRGRAYTYAAKGNFNLALADANKLVELAPSESGSYSIRGEVYQMMSKNDLAVADARKVLSIDANNESAKKILHQIRDTSVSPTSVLSSLKQTVWEYSEDRVPYKLTLYQDNSCFLDIRFGGYQWKGKYKQDGNKLVAKFDSYSHSYNPNSYEAIWEKAELEIKGEYYVTFDKSVMLKISSQAKDSQYKDFEFNDRVFLRIK
jgi:tetratricopeptide (TPR) repeat protein